MEYWYFSWSLEETNVVIIGWGLIYSTCWSNHDYNEGRAIIIALLVNSLFDFLYYKFIVPKDDNI